MRIETINLRDDGTSSLDIFACDGPCATEEKRPAVIICPGGAYLLLSPVEADPVAARFMDMGYQTFILRYPTYFADHKVPSNPAQMELNEGAAWPEPVVDGMRAMAWVREHADELHIDEDRVYMMGFSAGAHLACTLAERFDDEELLARAGTDAKTARPDALALCYPMLSGEGVMENIHIFGEVAPLMTRAIFGADAPQDGQLDAMRLYDKVRPDMPRTFVWHTTTDELVSPRESIALASALLEAGVPCEFHLFERGAHGQGLCDEASASDGSKANKEAAVWPELAHAWFSLPKE